MTNRDTETAIRVNGWAIAGLALGIAVWTAGWVVWLFAAPLQLMAAAAGLVLSAVGYRRSGLVDQYGMSIYRGRIMSIIGLVINSLCVLVVLILAALFWGFIAFFGGRS